jgi:hypothetical protein
VTGSVKKEETLASPRRLGRALSRRENQTSYYFLVSYTFFSSTCVHSIEKIPRASKEFGFCIFHSPRLFAWVQ